MAARSRATVPPPLPSNSYNNESSSLVMSLSSDEESKVDLSHHYCVSSAASPANSVVPVGISLLPPTPRSLLPSAPVNRASSSPRQKQQQPPTTGKLQAPNKGSVGIEVQRLTKMIVELEKGRLADQTAFWERWKELQDAKAQAEEGIQALHGVLTSSKEATTELVKALEALREENHSIHMELTRERKARAQQNREAIELERQLTAKVEQLTQQLAQVEQQQQSSQQTASLDQKNRELNRMLRSAQRNLLEIKKERDTMIRAVLDAAGRKDTEVSAQGPSFGCVNTVCVAACVVKSQSNRVSLASIVADQATIQRRSPPTRFGYRQAHCVVPHCHGVYKRGCSSYGGNYLFDN
jgi:hypothetical protein